MGEKQIAIFAQDFAQMKRADQKSHLASGQGLFEKRSNGQGILGPTFEGHSSMTGDAMSMEVMIFGGCATKEQQIFYEYISKINKALATEYILYVIRGIQKWKHDIMWLEVLEHYLLIGEKSLEKSEKILRAEQDLGAHMKIPEVVKRHYPEVFRDIEIIEMTGKNIRETVEKIRAIEMQFKEEESFVHKYLKKTKKQFPFLFEK